MAANSEKKPKKSLGLHPLFARYAENAGDIDAGEDLEKMGLTEAYQVQVYRLEPSTYGGPEFLRSFNEVPEEKALKNLFGGGKYLLKLFQNGRYQPGPASLRIAGDPKVVQEDTDTLDNVPVATGSSEGVLFGILERKIQGLEGKLDDMLRSVGTASGGGGALNPDRLAQLIDVANAKRLETRLLESSLGVPDPRPAPVAPVSAPVSSGDSLDMMLKVFKAGVEFASGSGDGGDEDLVSKGLSRLLDLFGKATGKAPQVPSVEPARVSNVPDVNAGNVPGAEEIEAQRRAVERDVTERKAADMQDRLRQAVDVMTTAMSSDVEYSVDEICRFVLEVLSPEEVVLIGDKLTFENVRKLMTGDPESQMLLDSHRYGRDGVESVLAGLRKPEGGTSVSNGSD